MHVGHAFIVVDQKTIQEIDKMRDKRIVDKDGIAFTPEEIKEYEDDLWGLRAQDNNPTAAKAANIRMWHKWGKRLGFPYPDDKHGSGK